MQSCFKLILTIVTTVLLAGCNQAEHKNALDNKAIRSVSHTYQEAYNQQDAAKMATQWASDATYRNPLTGESAKGKVAIEKLFKDKFAQNEKRHLEITINSIEFPNQNEAIENGVMQITIGDQPPQQIAYQTEYIKENGKWFVKAFNEIELQKSSSHFEQLKDLAWLVGKWKDFDDNVEISFDNQWDKHKNFITQYFKMNVYRHEDFEGKQIIAWDPVKEVIRSWVFDSDGEFGEGTWEKVDKSWYVSMHYNLSDGRIGTSKNIYTLIDDQSYTFASVEREIDGEILPDMNPVKVEKIE